MKLHFSFNFLPNNNNNHSMLKSLYTLLLLSTIIPSSLSEIKTTHILQDSRPLILFERFGFNQHGHVAVSISHLTWRAMHGKVEPNRSLMGFFLSRADAFARLTEEFMFNETFCALSSNYMTPVVKFDTFSANSTQNGSIPITDPDEYCLVFGNCHRNLEVSMDVHTEMYNLVDGTKNFLPAGQTILPKLFFLLFLIYSCISFLWIFFCIKQRTTVHKIHLATGALFIVKALKMICASEDKMYVGRTGTPHGWDVAFYVFGFLKGIMLFTVIILIGTGWSILKPYLQEREKNVLVMVIPLQVFENIAYVVISESGPATKDWITWTQIFLFIDITCCFAVFYPIIWSIRGLREASKTDGKAARNVEKLTLFRQFYVVVVGYLYFTRVGVSSIGSFLGYRLEWVTYALAEGASLILYVFIFHNFQPIEKNQYLVIDEEEEMAAAQILQDDDDDDDDSFEL